MFLRKDHRVVTQWEHSRLSGELATLLGEVFGIDQPELFGAIAVHDWPHFAGDVTDTIVVGQKTDEQQRQLVARLAGSLPLTPLAALVVRMHWYRMSDEVTRQAIDPQRIAELRQRLGLSEAEATKLDQWTDLCDTWAYYLSRAEAASGNFDLPCPQSSQCWRLRWSIAADSLSVDRIELVSDKSATHVQMLECRVSLLTYQADGYPQNLAPQMQSISCKFSA